MVLKAVTNPFAFVRIIRGQSVEIPQATSPSTPAPYPPQQSAYPSAT